MPVPLTLSGLHVGYGDQVVLNGIDLTLEAGCVHGLAGLNGSGKTTLLDAIAGLLEPTAGSMTLGQRALRRDDVAYLPTDLHFYPRLSGREHLEVFAASRPKLEPPLDVDGWAALFSVPLDRAIDEYSAGMRRKLALIATLTLRRPVLLLDEPANTLDLEANALLEQLLAAVAAQGAIVVVTAHVLDSLAACDRVHRLSGGTIAGSYHSSEFSRLVHHLMTHDLKRRRETLDALARGLSPSPPGRNDLPSG